MLLILLIFIPTMLITIRSFSRSDRLNRVISKIVKTLIWVCAPVFFVLGIHSIVTNWSSYSRLDIIEKVTSWGGGIILGILFDRLNRRSESKKSH